MTETILREKPHAGNPPAREKSPFGAAETPARCGKLGIGAVLWALASASMAAESPSTLIFVNPASSSFWHAAPGNVLTLPIEYPDGATTATLTVSGVGHEASYPGITGETFELTLPAATTPGTENTYALTLAFDRGESVSARVSVLAGLEAGGAGATRCVTSAHRAWRRSADRRMTLPVPFGATALTLNGETVETGLGGAQGFCTVSALPAALALTVGDTSYETAVVLPPGGSLFLR